MSDPSPEHRELDELEKRVREAKAELPAERGRQSTSGLGIAFKLVAELLAGVVVGGLIGWGLDRYFGTAPILFIVMFFVGAAAGFRNVLRAAKEMNENPDS